MIVFKRHRPGFTFIEFLLGMAVFSIIALALYGSFFSAVKINHKAKTINSLYREAGWALDMLSREMENMVFYKFDSSSTGKMCFIGKKNSVQFMLAKDSGLKVVKYSSSLMNEGSIFRVIVNKPASKIRGFTNTYEKGLKREALIRQETAWSNFFQTSAKEGLLPEAETDILTTRLQEGSLQFFYAYLKGTKDNPQVEWKNEWDKDTLPYWIRVEMIFVSAERTGESLKLTRDIFIPIGSWGRDNIF